MKPKDLSIFDDLCMLDLCRVRDGLDLIVNAIPENKKTLPVLEDFGETLAYVRRLIVKKTEGAR